VKRKTSKKRKKPTLEQTARKLSAIAERQLSTLTPEEREVRVTAFERAIYKASSAKLARTSKNAGTQVTRVVPKLMNNRFLEQFLIVQF
jgi:hypothetical protein